jgi:hypothetical protein
MRKIPEFFSQIQKSPERMEKSIKPSEILVFASKPKAKMHLL